MHVIKGTIKLLLKQKTVSILIIIQLIIAFTTMILAIDIIENTYHYINRIKSIISVDDTIQISSVRKISKEKTANDNFNSKLLEFYDFVKKNYKVDALGTFNSFSDYFDEETLREMKPGVDIVSIDQEFRKIYKYDIYEGRDFTEDDYKNINEDIEPIIISNALSKEFSVGEIIRNKYKVIGILKDESSILQGGSTRVIESLIDNGKFAIAPLISKQGGIRSYFSFLTSDCIFKLKDSSKVTESVQSINRKAKELSLPIVAYSISEEIQYYKDSRKTGFLVNLGLSALLFSFSCIGIIGTILASMEKRKREFGIKIALGLTGRSLSLLICFEIFLLVFIASISSLFIVIVMNYFSNGVGLVRVGAFTGISLFGLVFIVTGISSIIPMFRISKMNPVDLIRGID